MTRKIQFEDRKGVQFSLDKQARDQLADLVRATKTNASQVVRELIAVAHASGLATSQEDNHNAPASRQLGIVTTKGHDNDHDIHRPQAH